MTRPFRVFLMLCVLLAQSLALWSVPAMAVAGPGNAQHEVAPVAEVSMPCCDHDTVPHDGACAADACGSQCAGHALGLCAATYQGAKGRDAWVALTRLPSKPAPVFREERPPRRPV